MSNYLASILQNVYDITTNNDITLIHLNTNSNNEWMQENMNFVVLLYNHYLIY